MKQKVIQIFAINQTLHCLTDHGRVYYLSNTDRNGCRLDEKLWTWQQQDPWPNVPDLPEPPVVKPQEFPPAVTFEAKSLAKGRKK